ADIIDQAIQADGPDREGSLPAPDGPAPGRGRHQRAERRLSEDTELLLPLAVADRSRMQAHVLQSIDPHVLGKQVEDLRIRLERVDSPPLSHAGSREHSVLAEMGADVEERHSGSEKAKNEVGRVRLREALVVDEGPGA